MENILPYFQPIVELKKNGELQVKGFEILARMRLGNEVESAGEFIENIPHDKTLNFDLHMLDFACSFIREFIDSGVSPEKLPVVSVNFFPSSLAKKEAAQKISETVKKYNISPNKIGIEILEDSFGDDEPHILSMIADLNSAGHPISVDDLGAGESTVSRVRAIKGALNNTEAPLTVKIDGRIGALSEWAGTFASSLEHNVFKGLSLVYEGVSEEAKLIVMKEFPEVGNVSAVKLQTESLYSAMLASQALSLFNVKPYDDSQPVKKFVVA